MSLYQKEKSGIALAMDYFYFAVESEKGHFIMMILMRKWYDINESKNDY